MSAQSTDWRADLQDDDPMVEPTIDQTKATAGRPIIGVMVADFLPVDIEEDVETDLEAPGLPLAVRRMPFGPFAGLELYLPSAVMIFIAAGYFNGFLAKLGEDHYDKLKRVAKRLFHRSSTIGITKVSTSGKDSSSGFSLAYSVTGEVVPGLHFKLILRTDIDPDAGQRGVETFLNLIRDIHAGVLDQTTIDRLLDHRPIGGTVLVTFDSERGEIVTVPPHLGPQK
ncbi:hypothetical protein GCM10017083_22720 [Thalassobaculum fulvum]|uniref:Uncharacterized protein n=1 Tax=Thalassobaculum fulvum TaxID=1633335 RepID=A0A918XRG8_9PROT|nr:hypothetical protein [Thalassobaculum fulvum]GHD49862.1 hypothetical protein GCM10017083_22720 [Thalassobaculum fulvum]